MPLGVISRVWGLDQMEGACVIMELVKVEGEVGRLQMMVVV